MNELKYDFVSKFVVLGESGGGKTSLLLRFTDQTFTESSIETIGVEFKLRIVKLKDGRRVKVNVWDTSGQERFRTITSSYYRGANGVLLVFDLTDAESFSNLQFWFREVDRYCENVKMVLVGNKVDLSKKRVVEYTVAKDFADSKNLPYIETSAKENINVEEAFLMLATEIGKNAMSSGRAELRGTISVRSVTEIVTDSEKEKKKCAC